MIFKDEPTAVLAGGNALRTAKRHWAYARSWLHDAIRAG